MRCIFTCHVDVMPPQLAADGEVRARIDLKSEVQQAVTSAAAGAFVGHLARFLVASLIDDGQIAINGSVIQAVFPGVRAIVAASSRSASEGSRGVRDNQCTVNVDGRRIDFSSSAA